MAVFFFLLGPGTIALVHAAKGEGFVDVLLRLWRHGEFENGPLWFAEALLIFGAGYPIWRAIRPAARDGSATPFPNTATLLAAPRSKAAIDAAPIPAQTSARQTAGRSRSHLAAGARKVRAPRRQGGGQHPPGATLGIAPQRADRRVGVSILSR